MQLFVDNLATQNEGSASTVGYYLRDFEEFCSSQLQTTPSDLIKALKAGTATEDPKEEQVYKVLARYAAWMKKNRFDNAANNAHTVRMKISWARTLLEANFIPISRTIFKQQVKSPKAEEPDISPVSKKTIQQIIIASEDIRMQTYELWLASMGWRATESLTVQNQNFEGLDLKTLKFTDNPSFVNISGKTAKTKKGKRRQLTAEMRTQIEKYLAHKYRPRTINYRKGENWVKKHLSPEAKPTDYLFLPYHSEGNPIGKKWSGNAYRQMSQRFASLMDRQGIKFEENGKRHQVTLHTLRRFCYTTCKRAVDESYAKYRIGRKIHEYDKATDEQLGEDFAKVELMLTFLDSSKAEEMAKEVNAKIKELEQQNKDVKQTLQNVQTLLASVLGAQAKNGTTTIPSKLFEQAGVDPDLLTTDPDAKKKYIADFKRWAKKEADKQ